MIEAMFDPLPGPPRTPRGRRAASGWMPVIPVPEVAPAPPSSHYKRGKPSTAWTYRDATGDVLGHVLRFDLPSGTKEFLPLTYCRHSNHGRAEWRWKSWPAPRPLYGLDRLAARPEAPVVVVEGEKAADAVVELLPDHVVIASPSGSNSAGKADWSPLAQRQVVIWPDADEPGLRYAAAAAKCLTAVAAIVAIIMPPEGVSPGWDAADALAEGWDAVRTLKLLAGARPAAVLMGEAGNARWESKPDPANGRQRAGQSTNLIDLVGEAELWHSPDREAYATVYCGDHFENWLVRSRDFRLWLTGHYYELYESAPGSQAMEDALRVMEARAIHGGTKYPVFRRVGDGGGAVYLDLANDRWQAVEVTKTGWTVVDRPPVKFIRSAAMRSLLLPEPGGSIETVREFLNVRSEEDFKLIVAWLVGAFRPRGPYPILMLGGEQGSGKSILSRLCRALVDPNIAPIRSAPRDEQSLFVAARNSWTIVLDNLSELPGWLSDSLCRLATGGGFGTRALYSDGEEIVFNAQRPVILNGIPDLASRADLADRCIPVVLPSLPDSERRSEDEFWREFKAKQPFILGALLDAVSGTLRRADEAPRARSKTRMADFADWVIGAEEALGWQVGAFMEAYDRNRASAVDTAIEQDPVAEAVRDLAGEGNWEGTATELLTELEGRVSESVRKSRIWPSANKLRGRLRRVQAPLRNYGIVLDLDHRASSRDRTRLIGIRKPDRAPAE